MKTLMREMFSKTRLILILAINMVITIILTAMNYGGDQVFSHVFFSNFIFSYSIGLSIYIGINIIECLKLPFVMKIILTLGTICITGIAGSFIGSFLYKIIYGIDINVLQSDTLLEFMSLSLIFGVSAYYIFVIIMKSNERKLQLLEEQKLRTDIELQSLRARINPHFLFNTLNSVAGLIYIDQKKAESMLVQLSELLRFNLSISENKFVELQHELKAVEDYLNIEKIRLGDRLEFSIDNKLDDLIVPPMTLLTLVENAIKHGISGSIEGGIVKIKLNKTDDKYHLSVYNTCENPAGNIVYGYGLTKLREILQLSYKDKAELVFSVDKNGITAVIEIRS